MREARLRVFAGGGIGLLAEPGIGWEIETVKKQLAGALDSLSPRASVDPLLLSRREGTGSGCGSAFGVTA